MGMRVLNGHFNVGKEFRSISSICILSDVNRVSTRRRFDVDMTFFGRANKVVTKLKQRVVCLLETMGKLSTSPRLAMHHMIANCKTLK